MDDVRVMCCLQRSQDGQRDRHGHVWRQRTLRAQLFLKRAAGERLENQKRSAFMRADIQHAGDVRMGQSRGLACLKQPARLVVGIDQRGAAEQLHHHLAFRLRIKSQPHLHLCVVPDDAPQLVATHQWRRRRSRIHLSQKQLPA